MHRTRNAAYGQPYRGFESLPLRHPTPMSTPESGGISNPRFIPLLAFVFDKARSQTTRSLRERYGFESLPLRHLCPPPLPTSTPEHERHDWVGKSNPRSELISSFASTCCP